MYLDSLLQFDPAGTAVTATADSTNTIDLGAARDLGVGEPDADILVMVQTSFTCGTASSTLNVQLMGAPDDGTNTGTPGTFSVLVESGTLGLGRLVAGMKLLQVPVAAVVQGIVTPIETTGTASASSTSLTVASVTGLAQGMFVTGAGIVPGTTIVSIAALVVTLSTATTAALSSTPVTFNFAPAIPRYLKLHYIASTTMTGGAVQSDIVLGLDEPAFYPPGVVVNN